MLLRSNVNVPAGVRPFCPPFRPHSTKGSASLIPYPLVHVTVIWKSKEGCFLNLFVRHIWDKHSWLQPSPQKLISDTINKALILQKGSCLQKLKINIKRPKAYFDLCLQGTKHLLHPMSFLGLSVGILVHLDLQRQQYLTLQPVLAVKQGKKWIRISWHQLRYAYLAFIRCVKATNIPEL